MLLKYIYGIYLRLNAIYGIFEALDLVIWQSCRFPYLKVVVNYC
jgi:hypothetical protein